MTPSEKIYKCRKLGIKVNEIASYLGVSRQFLNKVSRGEKVFSPEKNRMIDTLIKSKEGCNNGENVTLLSDERLDNLERRVDEIERKFEMLLDDLLKLGK